MHTENITFIGGRLILYLVQLICLVIIYILTGIAYVITTTIFYLCYIYERSKRDTENLASSLLHVKIRKVKIKTRYIYNFSKKYLKFVYKNLYIKTISIFYHFIIFLVNHFILCFSY